MRGPKPLPYGPRPQLEDRTMKKARLILAVVLASMAISACSNSPTMPGDCVDPGGNHFYCE